MSPKPVLLAAALVLAAEAALAHPHVWIVARSGFRIEADRLVAVEVTLRFDELLSASLVADFDRDRDGRFDAAETARLERETFAGLAELDWLSRLRIAGRPARLAPPSSFRAELEGGLVVYRFERRLEAPAEPRAGPIALTIADPSWYVDVVLDPEAPASVTGELPDGCALAFEPDTSFENLAAPVPPVAALLRCARSS